MHIFLEVIETRMGCKLSHTTWRTSRGFSLVEILVVLSIISLVAAIVMFGLSKFVTTYNSRTAALEIITILDEARSQSMASRDDTVYGVHFASTSVTRFTGQSYATSSASNIAVELPQGIEIVQITLAGGGNDVVFSRITGTTTHSGTIRVRQTGTTTDRIITVHKTGIAEITQ